MTYEELKSLKIGDAIWAYRNGKWLPGRVEASYTDGRTVDFGLPSSVFYGQENCGELSFCDFSGHPPALHGDTGIATQDSVISGAEVDMEQLATDALHRLGQAWQALGPGLRLGEAVPLLSAACCMDRLRNAIAASSGREQSSGATTAISDLLRSARDVRDAFSRTDQ